MTVLLRRNRRRTAERRAADDLIAQLAVRDPDLGEHAGDVARIATAAALRLGLSDEAARQVGLAAELHDIGKLAIPDHILHKPAPLDPDEWQIMHTHPEIGAWILEASPLLAPTAPLVRASHERHDGTGYPYGLRGEQIPLGARIIAVCDAYDAMTTQRVYNEPMTPRAAIERLLYAAGTQFDPTVTRIVCETIEQTLPEPIMLPLAPRREGGRWVAHSRVKRRTEPLIEA
jgi:HD-GYP domain-containing protein (c-di-GMP phosphodiesterase class II)